MNKQKKAERVHLVRVQLNSFGKCLGRERRSRENRTACLCTEVAKNGVAAAMISTLCQDWRLQCSTNVPQACSDHHGQHFIFTIFFIPHLLHLHLALMTSKHQLVYTGCGSITSRVLRKQHGRHCELGTSNMSVQHVAEQPMSLAGYTHDLNECAIDLLHACSNICLQACRQAWGHLDASMHELYSCCLHSLSNTQLSMHTQPLSWALCYMHANGTGSLL